MAKKKIVKEEVPAQAQQEHLSNAPTSTKAHVRTTGGQHVRTYDLETHGENFADLADEFIKGHPGYRKVLE